VERKASASSRLLVVEEEVDVPAAEPLAVVAVGDDAK
jgi:hypothetical protein